MGRREAFALIAGRCSAAEAQSLRRLKDSREYLLVSRSWGEFCTTHLGISRRHVDRMLGYLTELGPEYFVMAQITHVTVDEYRAIAPHVTQEGLQWEGAPIALIPENSAQLAEGVKGLLSQERPVKPKAQPRVEEDPTTALLQRVKASLEALRALPATLSYDQKNALAQYLSDMRQETARLGLVWR